MDIQKIVENGGFIDSSLIAKEGKWSRFNSETGETTETDETFFIVRMSHANFNRVNTKRKSNNGEDVDINSVTIAACIRIGKEGEVALTYEQAESLDVGLAAMYLKGIGEVYSKKA